MLALAAIFLFAQTHPGDVKPEGMTVLEMPEEFLVIKPDARLPLDISLAEAFELVAGFNIDLIGARLDRAVAVTNVDGQLDNFVPALAGQGGYQDQWEAEASRENNASLSRLYSTTGTVQLSENIPTGTSVLMSAGLTGQTDTAALPSSVLPELPASRTNLATLHFEITQSLLRRLGLGVDLANLRSAKAGARAAEQRLLATIEAVVHRVALTYFNLYEDAEVYKVRREGRRLAIDLLDATKRRIAAGSAAPYEIFQAQSTLAARYSIELSAEQDLNNAEEALLQLFNARIREDGRVRADRLMVLTEPPVPYQPQAALDQLTAIAMNERPDYLATSEDISGADALRYAAFRQLMPELSITGFVTGQTQASAYTPAAALQIDTGQVAIDRRLVGNLGTAIGNLGSSPFYNSGFTINLQLPFFFGVQRANLRSADAALERARAVKLTLAQQVKSDVALALAEQKRALQRIEAAKIGVQAAKQNLVMETRKQKLGSSTTFDVLRVQDEVTTALASVVQAEAELGRAAANLRYAIGRGRQGMKVDVQPVFH